LYLKNPIALQKSSRKTNERKLLKAEIGLSDEQIEGWATVVNRLPQLRDKILAENTDKIWKQPNVKGSITRQHENVNSGSGHDGRRFRKERHFRKMNNPHS
jgi:hypothetical protein